MFKLTVVSHPSDGFPSSAPEWDKAESPGRLEVASRYTDVSWRYTGKVQNVKQSAQTSIYIHTHTFVLIVSRFGPFLYIYIYIYLYVCRRNLADRAGLNKALRWSKIWNKSFKTGTCLGWWYTLSMSHHIDILLVSFSPSVCLSVCLPLGCPQFVRSFILSLSLWVVLSKKKKK